ncbi:histidine kinase [Pseudonocardia sp. H11422]|uniref:ATP-dependent DNA ligase n=1 Tax=Pseudonocardia sp. H11422 TaxID=2835866 RepID=UPI00292F247A|nr:histidine kinase [Pseudonocardia sp. H11422]
MLAAPGELPAGSGWVVEFAWDGLRCIAYARPGRVRLLTVNDRSVTSTFPELAVLAAKAPRRGMVLDGTVVALDGTGIPDRRLLARRTATRRPSPALVEEVPVGFFVSDLLWLDGVSTLASPYRRRRELIDELGLAEEPVVLSPSWPAREADHVMQTATGYRLDGLYAKRLDAPYQPGRRSPYWLRVPLRRSRQVVVGGWTPADPRRTGSVAALLLGVPGPAGLRYVGRVGLGSGPHRQAITDVIPELVADSSPFAGSLPPAVEHDAVWALPRLVGRVEFREWTPDGRLRLPAWRGLVDPAEVGDGLRDDGPQDESPTEAAAMVGVSPDGDTIEEGASAAASSRPTRSRHSPEPPAAVVDHLHARRLDQHFVYNSLNTIAALVRTDPTRARELLLGFADLSRVADQPADTATTLGEEIAAVRAYLQLEQARFGKRLRVEVTVDDALHEVPVVPLSVLATVRATVQQRIEPRPEGGTLCVSAEAVGPDCIVSVVDAGVGEPTQVRVGAAPDRAGYHAV